MTATPAPARPVLPSQPAAPPPLVAAAPRPERPAAQPIAGLATAEQVPDARPAAAVPPDAAALAPQSGPVTRARAETAFAGPEGITDPVSLAAVQSFMAPQTVSAEADIRDDLTDMLSSVPCSRLQARFLPETGTLELFGHVPDSGAADPVLAALTAQMGADIPVEPNLRVLPAPQCQVLADIDQVGLPQSTDQVTNPLIVGADAHAREFRYAEGDRLTLDLTGADYPAYFYVDYFDASGQVIHLWPGPDAAPRRLEPEERLPIGGDDGGLRIMIGPPFGQEIAVAFAASEPLFDAPRPTVEPAAPYLAEMRAAIAEARARLPDFKGEWVYFLVVTRPAG